MKLVITATGSTLDDTLEPRFGRAPFLICVDSETGEVSSESNAANAEAAQGAGIQTAGRVASLGGEAVVTGDVGPKAFDVLATAGVAVYLADDRITVAEAVERWKKGELRQVDNPTVGAHRRGR